MNFKAKLILSALGVCALPLAQAGDFEDFGQVVRVQPRIEQIRTPRRECRTDYVQAPVQQQRGQGGTVVGGIAGAQEQAVQRCRTVESMEQRTNGYDVTYDYRGHTYTTVMPRDPGNRIRLRVSVEPEQY